MTEAIIQSILYFTLWCAVAFTCAGFYLTWKLPKQEQGRLASAAGLAQAVELEFWIYRCLTALSVISVSAPYIGLFGTVWHIIGALSGIGGGNLNVAAIAAPIGQALYATLWGLGAAIPALIAHRLIASVMALRGQEKAQEAAPAKATQTTYRDNTPAAVYAIDATESDFGQSPVHPGRA